LGVAVEGAAWGEGDVETRTVGYTDGEGGAEVGMVALRSTEGFVTFRWAVPGSIRRVRRTCAR
jgi:hypothetical protein